MLEAEGSQLGTPHSAVQRELHAMGNQSIQSLQLLEGEEFDRVFLSQMITHHQGALDLANQVLDVARHPETREEAGKVISSQTKEIAQMTEWLKTWYGAEPSNKDQVLMRHDLAPILEVPIEDDRTFYQMMIHHHEGAIEMSRMVEGRTDRPELKEFARIRTTETVDFERYRQMAKELQGAPRVDAQ